MENLPQELIEYVCELLPLDDLKNVVTLSRGFQYASERASGAYAQFDLTRDNVGDFINLYSGRRWGYLRHVRFRTHLPPYYEPDFSDEDSDADAVDYVPRVKHYCRESSEELQETDKFFTKEIEFVFTTLRTIENNKSSGRLQLTIYTPIRHVASTCPHRQCTSWRLHLQNPDALPQITSVKALSLENETSIYPLEYENITEEKSLLKVDLRILIDLAVKLPRLEFLGCKLEAGSGLTPEEPSETYRYFTRDWTGPHRDSRHNFAKALENAAMPRTLREAQLDFLWPLTSTERIDQTEPVADLVGQATHDPFSNSLRILSLPLRKLDLRVVADTTLFWPADGGACWPHLESVCILFHISSPSGQWYFRGPLDEDNETCETTSISYPPTEDTADDKFWDMYIEDHGRGAGVVRANQFRVTPNSSTIVPFLTSFGRAACNMPVLKEACLWTSLAWDPSSVDGYEDLDEYEDYKVMSTGMKTRHAWGITYIAPGTLGFHGYPSQHYSTSRQLFWTTGSWRPSEELRQLFQHVGDQNAELIEYCASDRIGYRTDREVFDDFKIFGCRHPGSPWRVNLSKNQ